MPIDSESVIIQGDLSRADVRVLVATCAGRDVVEFGMGGSTLILARCASRLVSYDTSADWYGVTRNRIAQIPDKTCEPELVLDAGVPDVLPPCDVLFVDGVMDLRPAWVARHWWGPGIIMLHDSRAPETWEEIRTLLQDPQAGLWIESIGWHVLDSNMIVIAMRDREATNLWGNSHEIRSC